MTVFRYLPTTLLLVIGVTAADASRAKAELTLNFSAATNANLTFVGDVGTANDTFSFVNNPAGYDFQVTNTIGGLNTGTGLMGNLDGTFFITGVTGTTIQTATVGGTGQFSITDGNGVQLTATLTFNEIFTAGTGGAINQLIASVNVTNFSYSGTNQDLILLANSTPPSGSLNVSFSFTSNLSLSDLTETGANNSTAGWGGTLFSPGAPDPETFFTPAPQGLMLALAALPFLCVAGFVYRRRNQAAGLALGA